MAAAMRLLTTAFALAGLAAGSLDLADLGQVNYDDRMDGLWCIGLTASGFEQSTRAGRSGQFYSPSRTAIDHFSAEGANCFRVPITWERLQSTLGSNELDPVTGFVDTIEYITEDLQSYAIIVPYEGIGGGLRYNDENVDMSDFINLWTAISKAYAGNPRVVFELFEKPQYGCHNGDCGDLKDGVYQGFFGSQNVGSDDDGQAVRAWAHWCQGALDTIRSQGAENYVLVPGLKKSSCRDWNGAGSWGEKGLDGYERAGNLAMFALNDTAMRTAYSVHQFFDGDLTGTSTGCGGHDVYEPYEQGLSADSGLEQTITMAQRYNKKLWLTEVASFPATAKDTAEWERCGSKMGAFLETMASSGVFLGYQVKQFGCEACGDFHEDQWTLRPYNLDWYRLQDYGITTTSTTSTLTTSTSTTSTATTSTSTSSSTTRTSSTSTTSTMTSSTSTTSTITTSTSTVTTDPESDGARGLIPAWIGLALFAALASPSLA